MAVVFGTRPEAIKMAPVIKELEKSSQLELLVIATAQHRELLDQVLKLFQIKPDYDFDIMEKKQRLDQITSKILNKLSLVLIAEKPDLILIHGDTTTTLASALAAFYQQIPIAHIEAGLRTYDQGDPFPEEINRRLSDLLADLYLAPTKEARNNLLQEGIKEHQVFVTGNTVIDALEEIFEPNYKFEKEILNKIDFKNEKIVLLTVHRRENFGQPLINICQAIKEIAKEVEEIKIICPVHPNPEVKKIIEQFLAEETKVCLVPSLNYKDFINLIGRSDLILTDSGGVQEEASAFAKSILILREKTERPEVLRAKIGKLVGSSPPLILDEALAILNNEISKIDFKEKQITKLYGNGKAAEQIKEIIIEYLYKT